MKSVSIMCQKHCIQFQATLNHRSFYEKESNISVICTPQNSLVVDKLSGSDFILTKFIIRLNLLLGSSTLEFKLLSLQTAGHIYSFGQNQDSEVTHQEPVCPRDLSTLLVKSLFRKEILGEESSRHTAGAQKLGGQILMEPDTVWAC